MRLADAYARTPLAAVLELDAFRRHCPSTHLLRSLEGQAVFEEQSAARAFHFVVEGRVKLVRRAPGPRDSILEFVGVGSSVCQSVPLGAGRYCCDAVADAPITRLLVIPRREALGLIQHEPHVTQVFLGMLGARTQAMCARVVELSCGSSTQRLASTLLRLGGQLGVARGAATHVPLVLSRRDLAELCGMATETAIRAIRRLERAGHVRTVQDGFELLDEEALRAITRGEDPSARG